MTARTLLGRAGIVVAVLVVLLLPWPGVRNAYAWWFRAMGGLLFYMVGTEQVRLEPYAGDPGFDSAAHFTESAGGWACSLDSRIAGYVPSALFVALWCGTRMPRRVRARTLVVGLCCMQVYVMALIGATLLWRFTVHAQETSAHAHAAFFSEPSWRFMGRTLYELVAGITTRSLMPVVVWALVAVRREYWVENGNVGVATRSSALVS